MCLCVRERRKRGERDHNILLSHSLHHKSYFSNSHSVSQHKEKEVGIKTWRQWGKKIEKGRRRGGLRQLGSVEWSEDTRQNGYHLIPQRLRSTTHNMSYCRCRTDARAESHNAGIHIHFRTISAAPYISAALACPELQYRPSSPICVHFALHRQICIHNC